MNKKPGYLILIAMLLAAVGFSLAKNKALAYQNNDLERELRRELKSLEDLEQKAYGTHPDQLEARRKRQKYRDRAGILLSVLIFGGIGCGVFLFVSRSKVADKKVRSIGRCPCNRCQHAGRLKNKGFAFIFGQPVLVCNNCGSSEWQKQ